MTGTILITGANSSLATKTIKLLHTKHPNYTLLLTACSPQTITIDQPKSKPNPYPNPNIITRKLDLSSLPAVHAFATTIATEIQTGKLPPLSSIIATASYWNLRTEPELTADGYEKTFQINHIAHAALILRLLGYFDRESGGHVVLFSCDAHWPGKCGLERYLPAIPEVLDELVHMNDKPMELGAAKAKAKADHLGRGFQRYANSKLAVVM
ncbi:hypothetical protein BJX76DRAFT_354230 [Aspergillus varians]